MYYVSNEDKEEGNLNNDFVTFVRLSLFLGACISLPTFMKTNYFNIHGIISTEIINIWE